MPDPMTRPHHWTPSDPDQTHQTSWTAIETFFSTYPLLNHSPRCHHQTHFGICLSLDICSTPLYHPVYPSALLTLSKFARLYPFRTGL